MAESINVEAVDWSRVDGLAVGPGDDARAFCDLSNDVLTAGDDVLILASVNAGGELAVSWVCSTGCDLPASRDDEQRGKVVLRGCLVRAARIPTQLVVTDTERVVPDE